MELILWKDFSKRKNSTKIPTTAGTTFDIVLKEDTDMENPVIVLEPVDLGYTYAKFNNNYYFVDSEIVLTKNLMQLSLSMDSLASNKTAIGNTNAFIVYSSTGYNRNIPDPRITASVNKTITTAENTVGLLDKDGFYVISIANDIGSLTSAACQYAVSAGALPTIIHELMSTTAAEALQQLFTGKPLDSIISVLWMPVSYNSVSGSSFVLDTHLKYGDYQPANSPQYKAFYGSSTVLKSVGLINIPWHYDDFRRNSPYTTASLYIPCYGVMDVNMADFIGETHIKYEYNIDVSTGDVTFILMRNSDSVIINTTNFSIGVACPIAQTSVNAGGMLSGTSGVVGGLGAAAVGLMTDNAVAVLGGIGATIVSAGNTILASNTRSTSVRGSIQGRSSIETGTKLKLQLFSQNTENPDDSSYIARQGRPVMHYGTISSYSGYVRCDNASVEASVLSSERDEINSYLNSGFYYE